jgi:hypothetical protein
MSNPRIYLLNNNYPVNLPGSSSVIDHIETPVTNKREFFYNRTSLEMTFKSSNNFDVKFDNIKFYEVDMIPFFRYTLEENVDQTIRTPLSGVAPFVASNATVYSLTQSG